MTIVGARPQFIKAAVLSRKIRDPEYASNIEEFLIHTGQHYDANMSEVFFRDMEIPEPDVNLGIGSGYHGAVTGAMLTGIEHLILQQKPDLLLVYGDTNSTLAGALAASKLHIPVVHVEAGLRSFMMDMPEEQNRMLTDHLSTWLFCPTSVAVANLGAEGIPCQNLAQPSADHKNVIISGDIMLEAANYYRPKAQERAGTILKGFPKGFFLLTLHRAENTDDPSRLSSIIRAINAHPDIPAVFPVHPRTRKMLENIDLRFGSHVHIIDPVGYFEMLCLEDACSFVVTDSGGVQKEAFFFNKPCITLRDSTEWVELVECGWNKLVGADELKIKLTIENIAKPDGPKPLLYGNGNTAQLILNYIA
jgi:UDP-GlcNAc3NAcA epimerase